MHQNLDIYENQYGKHHIKTAGVLRDLGRVYVLEEHLDRAEHLLKIAFEIFERNNHPESYTCLESLAHLYQKKYEEAVEKNLASEAQLFCGQALGFLKQALDIVIVHFPEDSPHRVRVQDKIQKVKAASLSRVSPFL